MLVVRVGEGLFGALASEDAVLFLWWRWVSVWRVVRSKWNQCLGLKGVISKRAYRHLGRRATLLLDAPPGILPMQSRATATFRDLDATSQIVGRC